MTAYYPGIFRNESGKYFAYSGHRWREMYTDFSGVDQAEFAEPRASWGNLTRVTGSKEEELEKLKSVRAWWRAVAKQDDITWSDMIDLAAILMEDD